MYIHSIWFAARNDNQADFMGKLFKADGRWVFEYRFRYYDPSSTDPFDGKDRKSGACVQAPDDSQHELERFLEANKGMIQMLKMGGFSEIDVVDLQCDDSDPKVFMELGSRDWCHFKVGSEAQEHLEQGGSADDYLIIKKE